MVSIKLEEQGFYDGGITKTKKIEKKKETKKKEPKITKKKETKKKIENTNLLTYSVSDASARAKLCWLQALRR